MVHPLISLHPVVTDKRLSNVPLVPLTPTSPAGMATTPRCVMQSRPQVPSRRAWDMAPFLTGQPSSWLPYQPHRHRARTGVPHGWRLPLQLHAQELPDPLQQPVWTQEGRAQCTRSYSVVTRVTHVSLLTSTITQPVHSQAHYTTPTPTPSSPPAVAFFPPPIRLTAQHLHLPHLCSQLSSSWAPLSLLSSVLPTCGATLILQNEDPGGAFPAHKLPRLPSARGITVKLLIEASKALPHYPHPVVGDHVPLSEQTLLTCQLCLPTSKPHVYPRPNSCVRPPMKPSFRPTQSPIAQCLCFCGWTSLVLPGVGVLCLHVCLLTWPGMTEAEERKIDFNR